MSRLVVYVGPTLSEQAVRDIAPSAEIYPPAEGGSLARERFGPDDVVVIIDGYYRDRPAVRHKELLHVIDTGATVIGAASMGALRAAELDAYGMRGVGQVYEMYRTGEVSGDDEVAVKHVTDVADYEMNSIALVNLRRACQLAVADEVASGEAATHLIAAAKALVFDERSWQRIREVASQDLDSGRLAELERLIDYCRDSDCDIKARDARLALEIARDLRAGARDQSAGTNGISAGQIGTGESGPDTASPTATVVPQTVYLRAWLTYWHTAYQGPSGDWISELDVLNVARLFFPDYPQIHEEVLDELLREDVRKNGGNGATVGDYLSKSLGFSAEHPIPERLRPMLSAQERELAVPEQVRLLAIRVWPSDRCIEWRPAVIARLKALPWWDEWHHTVVEADRVRRGGGPEVSVKVAGLLFLRKWGVSGSAAARELGRRGFLTIAHLNDLAVRYAGLELQRQRGAAKAKQATAERVGSP